MLERKNIKFKSLLIILVLLFISTFSFAIFNHHDVTFAQEKEVYLGGQPIGLNINSDGLIVIDFKPIITASGNLCPAKDCGLQAGDMIIKTNDKVVKTPVDLQNAISNADSTVKLLLKRADKEIELSASPVFDPLAGARKLGLIVKNDISGIGTLTYVDNNGNYCSLGHKICDPNLNNQALYQCGKIYNANVIGVYKGSKDEAGALKGTFDKNASEIGSTIRNCEFGVYGKIPNKNALKLDKKVKIGSKNDVKPGKAYIYTTIEGSQPKRYQIEIVKAYNQDKPDIKSMVIRVTDKQLLEASGGIVQGMSGSPIIQDDKLIGAVTHVFLNDSTIGYGVYIDWLF